jgi:hypothetical protein
VRHVPLRFVKGGEVDTGAVWNSFCEIIVKYAGGDPNRIKKEMRIVSDLHLD